MFNRKLKEENKRLKEENQRLTDVLLQDHTFQAMLMKVEDLMAENGLQAMEYGKYHHLLEYGKEYEYYKGYASACKDLLDYLERRV